MKKGKRTKDKGLQGFKKSTQLGGGSTDLHDQPWRERDKWISDFEASLIYIVSSRTAKTT